VYEIVERLGPIATELFTCWSRLPARGCVPERKIFDPMAIARILPVVSVLERIGADEWRFRLVGTEIERRWGRTITGRDCLEIVSPEAARIMRREFQEIVEQPCGSWSQRRVELVSGRVTAIETLRLPLRANDGAISLILGCSGELAGTTPAGVDPPREIIMITDQEFFDIGAGCPATDAIVAAAAYRSIPSAPAGTS
jgi:hypothetical protein